MASLEKLETLQARILHRITELEISLYGQQLASVSLSSDDTTARAGETMESRLTAILIALGVDDFLFKRVPLDYYGRPLESRRDILGAPSIEHLCKSIVLHWPRRSDHSFLGGLQILPYSASSADHFHLSVSSPSIDPGGDRVILVFDFV